MNRIQELKDKVLSNKAITKSEAMELVNADLDSLTTAANEIRKTYCGNGFDICTIINAKSGKCSENCKYCAQSAYYDTHTDTYPLLNSDHIVEQAKINDEQGILRYSLVTSGKRLSDEEVDQACVSINRICKETSLEVCVSMGLLDETQFKRLKDAGATRVHNNLETSENNFSNICTTHTFQDKVNAINAAKKAGLSVCSGGIMGLGET